MIGLDTSILIQLAYRFHPKHQVTEAALREALATGSRLMLIPAVAAEFLHVATDTRRFDPAITMDQAVDWLRVLIANGSFHEEGARRGCITEMLTHLREKRLGRKRVLDTHIASAFLTAGISKVLTSDAAGFSDYPRLQVMLI